MQKLRILFLLSLVFCQFCYGQNRNNPVLSEQRIKEMMNDTTIFPKQEVNHSNTIPAGIKYPGIRVEDPANPPAIIDIVGNLNNKKTFKLSDVASSVRYIFLRHPSDIAITHVRDIVSDNEHIFINSSEGLFCYSPDGKYLYPVCINETKKDGQFNVQISGTLLFSNIDLLNGKLIARMLEEQKSMYFSVYDVAEMDAQMRFNYKPQELKTVGAKPQYKREIKGHPFFMPSLMLNNDQSLFHSNLTVTSINGDTLSKFNDYDTYKLRPGQGSVPNVRSKIYRFNGSVMLQKAHNDTIFRVVLPSLLTPVYVMRWGNYKPDIQVFMTLGNTDGKFFLSDFIETSRFIFIYYEEKVKSQKPENQNKFHWAVYDKTAKTLTHCLISGTPAMTGLTPIPPMFENDIEPVGMPFYPEGVNHKNEMYMTFSKSRLKTFIESGKFQTNKLQKIYDNMPDDSFCLMITK